MNQPKQFHANPDGFYNPWKGIPNKFLSSLGNSERNMNDMSANAFHGTGPPTARFIQPAHAFHGQGPPAPLQVREKLAERPQGIPASYRYPCPTEACMKDIGKLIRKNGGIGCTGGPGLEWHDYDYNPLKPCKVGCAAQCAGAVAYYWAYGHLNTCISACRGEYGE